MKIEIEFKNQEELQETINELDLFLVYGDYKGSTQKVHLLLDKLSETIE